MREPLDASNGHDHRGFIIMATHTSRLQSRDQVAEGTTAFHFDRPAGFEFKPGQAIDVVLSGPDASAPDARHTFSIVSAPYQEELVVATRMRASAFKKALGALAIGAPVTIEGPSGSLVLHKDRERAGVFIAGGIGITPFMSMLRQAARDRLPQDLRLLYSNHRPEDSAFLAELQQLEATNGRFRMLATMTQMGRSARPWSGRVGPIDEAFVQTAASALGAPIFYVAGPPGLVEAMRQTLVDAGIDEDDIRSEEFYGY
jgi:ferredoxin-NADP reductase